MFKKVYFENEENIKLILVGSVSLILMQTMIHIGVNIRLFPTTGMTLPFISYGGSSIISVSIFIWNNIKSNKKKNKLNEKFLITTGGSGGHVIPATILYDHLIENNKIIISTDNRGLKFLNHNQYQFEIIDTPKLGNIFILPFSLIKILFLFLNLFFF